MIDPPRLVQTATQPTAVIRLTIPRSEIRSVMGPGRAELMAALRAQGIAPAGPWFSHHLRMHPGTFDFEIGVPVTGPVAASGRVSSGHLPAVTAARAIYRGPYEGLGAAWPQLDAWIVAQGRVAGPSLWETYLTDPATSSDPATWQTELTRPLAELGRRSAGRTARPIGGRCLEKSVLFASSCGSVRRCATGYF